MSTIDATARLAAHCAETSFADLPADVREKLKRHVLDWLGVTLAGREHAESTPAMLAGLGGDAGSGPATSVATGEQWAPDRAAAINGALAHSLDFDDTHRESSLHPGAPVIPAALAVAEREDATTERLLAGVSAGFDVACVLGRAVDPDAHYDRGFHGTATCGTFGAIAAAGAVQGLSVAEFEDAFGVGGSQAAGSLQFLENGAWNKRLHPGLAARRGVTAASLAGAGFRGAADAIEGEYGFLNGYTGDPNPAAFDAFGDEHAVMETALKPYPCCRYMHAAIDALTDLSEEVDTDSIESIRVDLPEPGVRLTGDPIDRKRRPENFVDCQFSMPFTAALALSTGEAGLPAFLDAQSRLDDRALRGLMDRVDVVSTDAVQSLFPEQWAARVVVEAGGETYERFVETALGEPEKPLGWGGVTEKFEALARSSGVDDDTARELRDVVREFEDRPVSDLTDAVRRAVVATP
ncbi:MmgE/PrpD family protein [Halorussus sp. AFM4]|uniref:MmgE/PrpD family protein n=1 Tax=Halorussus sp. AFM4 TaxID=3421651 RepID=UPI003EBC0F3B